jgi:hypothetical protein
MNHKEFRKLYGNICYVHNAKLLSSIFDLNVVIFRSIKQKQDTKIDMDIKIQNLNEIGFLKSYKYAFLELTDSRNFNNFSNDENFLKSIYENSIKTNTFKIKTHLNKIYQDYLPRSKVSYLPKEFSTDFYELYNYNKKQVNYFSKLILDPLIKKKDWFTYDSESLNFLISKDKLNFNENSNEVIYKNYKDSFYFQDKLAYMSLGNKEYKYIMVSVTVDENTKLKIDVPLTFKASELLRKINKKLEMPKPQSCFNPDKKILKVVNLCDYFLDDSPIGLSNYVMECIKSDLIPEFVIVENPFLETNNNLNPSLMRRRSSSLQNLTAFKKSYILDKKFDNPSSNAFLKPKENKLALNMHTKNTPLKIIAPEKNLNSNNNEASSQQIKIENKIEEVKNLKVQNKIFDIAVFNPDLLNFTKIKKLRKQFNDSEENLIKFYKESIPFTYKDINFDELIMNSIQKKLKIELEKKRLSDITQNQIDIDDLIKEKRTRTKGISKII